MSRKTNIHIKFFKKIVEEKNANPLIKACCEDAIKALEKQIPKKPLFKTDYNAYTCYYACPSCGAVVIERMNYCSGDREYGEPSEKGCGQKLDWEV